MPDPIAKTPIYPGNQGTQHRRAYDGPAEYFPDRTPDAVLECGVRSRGSGAGFVGHSYLGDRVTPGTVIFVAEAGVIRIELNDRVRRHIVAV